MADLTKEQVNAKAEESAKIMQEYPPEVQYAVACVLPNFANGCYWGFTSMAEAMSHIELIKKEKNLTAHKIGNGCLIEVNPNYLIRTLTSLGNGLIKEQDVNNMKDCMAEAAISFEKFLLRACKTEPFSNKVAIYCVNDTNTLTYKSVVYPAFRLTAIDTLKYLATYRYQVKIDGNWVSPVEVARAPQKFYNNMLLSPTNTGVFIEIRSTYSPEQMKQLDAIFKKKWGIK